MVDNPHDAEHENQDLISAYTRQAVLGGGSALLAYLVVFAAGLTLLYTAVGVTPTATVLVHVAALAMMAVGLFQACRTIVGLLDARTIISGMRSDAPLGDGQSG